MVLSHHTFLQHSSYFFLFSVVDWEISAPSSNCHCLRIESFIPVVYYLLMRNSDVLNYPINCCSIILFQFAQAQFILWDSYFLIFEEVFLVPFLVDGCYYSFYCLNLSVWISTFSHPFQSFLLSPITNFLFQFFVIICLITSWN